MPENVDQRASCREHMLPIYERWTDGNSTMRKLLECESMDLAAHERLFWRLLNVTRQLHQQGYDVSALAALRAASVCTHAYIGVPSERFEEACDMAVQANIEALTVVPRRG
jgi:hypothetical protein